MILCEEWKRRIHALWLTNLRELLASRFATAEFSSVSTTTPRNARFSGAPYLVFADRVVERKLNHRSE